MWKLLLLSLAILMKDQAFANSRQVWWETATIYQIYVRSFMDSNDDGIGDINGIISKLDYLKQLGINAICLSPIYKSPLYDTGFDVTDFYAIHPQYGNMENFDQLVQDATSRKIKVILDFVPNHTSNDSEWFVKSSIRDEYYSDWYIWENGFIDPQGDRKPPNNWISVFRKSAWTYVASRDQYYLHQFGSSEPDLNYRNPVVVEEMKNIMKFWLEKGVAGLRLTSFNHIFEVDKERFGGRYPNEPKTGKPGVGPEDYDYLKHIYTKDLEDNYELLSQFREVFDGLSVRGDLKRVIITEACTNIKNAVRYYGDGHRAGAQIPINFALMDDLNKDSDARDIKYTIDRWMTYKPLRKKANWMTGNYNKNRVATRFRSELVDAYNMLVLLLPGVSLTYMGEEIGMENGIVPWSATKDSLACNTDDPVNFVDVSRDPVRTPFQWRGSKYAGFTNGESTWLPVSDGYENNNADSQHAMARSHFKVFIALSALRKRPAFKLGRFESLALSSDVFAFKRWHNDDTYVVVVNFGRSYHVVNLTAFELVFDQLEVEVSSTASSRTTNDNVQANMLDLSAEEALVLRMQV